MDFADAVDEVVGHVGSAGAAAGDALAPGLSVAVEACAVFAEVDPGGGWDVFGLDVCAAVDLLGLVLFPVPEVVWPRHDRRLARRLARRLVAALAEFLEADAADAGALLVTQLQRCAAAAQLRRAAGALA